MLIILKVYKFTQFYTIYKYNKLIKLTNMGCGCKGAGSPPPPPPQTPGQGQGYKPTNQIQQQSIQESIRSVVQKYYSKGR